MKGFTLVGSILGMTEALSEILGLVRELIVYTAILPRNALSILSELVNSIWWPLSLSVIYKLDG